MDISESTDYDFASNINIFASKISRLIFYNFAAYFVYNFAAISWILKFYQIRG